MAEIKYLDKTGLGTVWSKVKGIVTPKADKVSGATNGHLAGLNSSGNLTDSGLAATNIAQKDGSYSGMTVGAAEDLVSAESVASEFTSRITGGSTAVGKGGTALVEKFKGRTIVWNQLVNGETPNNVTVDTSVTTENKYIDLVDGSSSGRILTFPNGGSVPEGHKALVLFIIKSDYDNAPYLRYYRGGSSYSNIILSGYAPNVWQISYMIIENGFIAHSDTGIIPYGSTHVQGKYISTPLSGGLKVFDLTLMFGAGNEPTVEEFKALYPGLDYAYHPGKLINNGLQSEYDLTFNQIVQNGNFTSTNNWTANNGSFSVSNNEALYTITTIASESYNQNLIQQISVVKGHKYYSHFECKSSSGYVYVAGTMFNALGMSGLIPAQPNVWKKLSGVGTLTADGTTSNYYFYLGASNRQVGDTMSVRNCVCVDLTLMFGAGNEPTTPEEFEAMFPANYYPYDTGTPGHYSFSQFKTAIETVGFNLLNDDFEQGVINAGSGANEANASWIRTRTFSSVIPGSSCFCKRPSGSTALYLYFYDESGSYLGVGERIVIGATGTIFTVPQAAKYVRATTNLTSYTNDICINISDPSRNGTYEPYWRSELELGLGDIKVKSHNIWDEQVELGYFDENGVPQDSSARLRAKNYTAVTPGKLYCFCMVGTHTLQERLARVVWYDSSYNIIKVDAGESLQYTLIAPQSASYVKFHIGQNYGTTYGDDICLSISSSFDGQYESHGDNGLLTKTGGLKSAGTVYDEISGGKLVKRIESVDLGTLAWTKQTNYFGVPAESLILPHTPSTSSIPNILCVKYETGTPNYVYAQKNKGITVYTNGSLVIVDSDYNSGTVDTFKASLSGVPLYYALAKPIEYELADALPTAMRNDPYGTERRLPEDTAAIVTAPFRADITYSTNIKEAVQSMPQNFINVNSMQDFLAELGTLMGGTWTMRPADGKFDFTFTPNPSNE